MNFDTKFLNTLTTILHCLKMNGIDDAVVGGGCLRDMLFEKEVKDIDVFYSKGQWEKSTWQNFAKFEQLPLKPGIEEYEESKFTVTNNLKTHLIDLPIQLIKVEDNPYKHIDFFPINICRVAFGCVQQNGYPILQLPPDVLEDYFDKKCYYDSDTSPNYLARIKEKYNDWTFYN